MDSYWSHKIKRIERKAMTNLDSILKSRDITLSTKIYRSGAANVVSAITVLIYQEGFLKLQDISSELKEQERIMKSVLTSLDSWLAEMYQLRLSPSLVHVPLLTGVYFVRESFPS